MEQTRICKLALADGFVMTGTNFGAEGTSQGEIVFNTGMTRYQEVLTDPSYTGQIVAMTYPLIGNYGINTEDVESRDRKVQVRGLVIKELSPIAGNFRSSQTLQSYLAQDNVIGIAGVDTRGLTRHIRLAGAMNAVISTEILDDEQLVTKAKAAPSMVGLDLVRLVSPDHGYDWSSGYDCDFAQARRRQDTKTYSVVAIDCGAKTNIFRNLVECGCNVRVVGATASAEDILAHKPDGVFVSNGPGDPGAVSYTIESLRSLIGVVPIFGICLGHQLLGLAMGAKTLKLKFGHHGLNHPVRNQATGTVEITSQNHGFAVDENSLVAAGAVVTHINLNDETVEGFSHPQIPVFSVQYHPEASPGPHDATYLFDCFCDMMETGSAPSAEQMHQAQQRLAQAGATPS